MSFLAADRDEPPRQIFPGQRVCVVPRPQVDAALRQPATRQLTVVDAGYYPRARGHRRERERGTRDLVVLLCGEGEGELVVGDERYELRASHYAVLPAFVPHRYRSSAEEPWSIWWVHLRGADIGDLTRMLMPDGRAVTRLHSADRAVAAFDELLGLLERRLSPAHILASSGMAWQLLTRLAADRSMPADRSPLERAMRLLEERVDGTFRVDEVAAIVGLSASHLSALFRAATGGGPLHFHTGVKMARARELLDSTTLGIAEVAARVGYVDALYFSRQFRRHHGASPSEYRAQAKG